MKIKVIKIISNIAGLASSILIVLMANTSNYFGKTINLVVKCTDKPETSFPCYGIYDTWITFIFSVLGVYFLIKIILFFLSVYFRK
jgi:hypothetical protein